VQQFPLQQLESLDALLGVAGKKASRSPRQDALETLKELFMHHLLPDRKLIPFEHRPFEEQTDQKLLMWLFEDELKKRYEQFIEIMQNGLRDPLTHFRRAVLQTAYELVITKPEQEFELLSMLLNKLGDPERQIASKASYLLQCLTEHHPQMKAHIIKEVDQYLARPNLSEKAIYYAIIFLNQIVLHQSDYELSAQLITVYFSLFKKWTKDDENIKSEGKLLSALLTGVNRAFPFAAKDYQVFEDQMNTLFRVVHSSVFSRSIQAMLLIFQVMSAQNNISDRFYRALYAKLLAPEFISASRPGNFVNLLFKALKRDENADRVCAFVKRILQCCVNHRTGIVVGLLLVVSELIRQKPYIYSMVSSTARELLKAKEETDAKQVDGDDAAAQDKKGQEEKPTSEVVSRTSTVREDDLDDPQNEYDPAKRQPEFACARQSWLWELNLLGHHAHPTVAKFAKQLLRGNPVRYPGDPLQDFSLGAFLERFAYKKPKKSKMETAHISHMQRQGDRFSRVVAPVNTDGFLSQDEHKVREHELFFYNYFKMKNRSAPKKAKLDSDEEAMTEDIVGTSLFKDDDDDMGASDDEEQMDDLSDVDLDHLDELSESDGDDDDDDEFDYDDMKQDDFVESDPEFSDDDLLTGDGISSGDDESDDEAFAKTQLASDDDHDEMDFVTASASSGKSKNKKEKISPFVSADDFESLLNADPQSSKAKRIHPKQDLWLSKRDRMLHAGEKRSRRSEDQDDEHDDEHDDDALHAFSDSDQDQEMGTVGSSSKTKATAQGSSLTHKRKSKSKSKQQSDRQQRTANKKVASSPAAKKKQNKKRRSN